MSATIPHPARAYPRSYRVERNPPCPLSGEGIHDYHWLPPRIGHYGLVESVTMRCSLCGDTRTWKRCPHDWQQWGDDMRWERCTICGQTARRQWVDGRPV